MGLVYLFNLEWWEARVLTFINWLLNTGAALGVFILVAAVVTVAYRGGDNFDDPQPPAKPSSPQEQKVLDMIAKLHGSFETDPDNPEHPVVEVCLAETSATDSHLAEVAKLSGP